MDGYVNKKDVFNEIVDSYHIRTDIQFKALREALNKVPIADVVPVQHAHWIEKKHPQYPDICHNKYFCSHCNKTAPTYYLDYSHEIISEKWDYCPNCWAIMDEEVNE